MESGLEEMSQDQVLLSIHVVCKFTDTWQDCYSFYVDPVCGVGRYISPHGPLLQTRNNDLKHRDSDD